jgi:hypothetical protein
MRNSLLHKKEQRYATLRGSLQLQFAKFVQESGQSTKRCKITSGLMISEVTFLLWAWCKCILLLSTVCTLFRDVTRPDQFSWPCSSTGQYTAKSNLPCSNGRLCLVGSTISTMDVWPTGAWHGLQDETLACLLHLFAGRAYCQSHTRGVRLLAASLVWNFGCFQQLGIVVDSPQMTDSLQEWWFRARKLLTNKERRGFDTLTTLICCRLETAKCSCHSEHQ